MPERTLSPPTTASESSASRDRAVCAAAPVSAAGPEKVAVAASAPGVAGTPASAAPGTPATGAGEAVPDGWTAGRGPRSCIADQDEREDERQGRVTQPRQRRSIAAHAGHAARRSPLAGAARWRGTCRASPRCAPGAARSARPPAPGSPLRAGSRAPPGQPNQAVSIAEDDRARRTFGKRGEARRQHARHGDAHQQVRDVGVGRRPRRAATAGPATSRARARPPPPRA